MDETKIYLDQSNNLPNIQSTKCLVEPTKELVSCNKI